MRASLNWLGVEKMDVKDLAVIDEKIVKTQNLLEEYIKKADGKLDAGGVAMVEAKGAIDKLSAQLITLTDRATDLEQKLNESMQGGAEYKGVDIGKICVESAEFKEFAEGKRDKASISVKTAIINATGASQPLVQADRQAGIITAPNRVLRMRDVIAPGSTTSNMIEFAKENVFTNNAGPTISGSPEQVENVTKPESAITFTLASEPVRTIAHWIPVSKQVLADSPMLQSYINSRLMYGLKLKEDTQLLLGTGINGQLQGLYTNRTAYVVSSPTSLYNKKLDVLRHAIAQAQAAEYEPNAIVLNSLDWAKIELAKVGTSDDRYVVGDPKVGTSVPTLWGKAVVVTNSLTAGTFLLGAFDQAAQLFDRETATIEIGLNSDNFVKNMRTILCEERCVLAIYRAGAIVGGAFPS
jgi:HK97 family phage major capsid protein